MNRHTQVMRITVLLVAVLCSPYLLVGAQGGTWATGVNIQNLSQDQQASIRMDIYDSAGLAVQYLERTGILPGGATSIYMPSEDTVPFGLFSSVVASDQPVAAIVNNVNRDLKVGDSYMGTSVADLLMYAPLVFRNYGGYNTTIYMQNAHSAEQELTLKLFPNGQASPAVTKTYLVPAYASATADLSAAEFAAFGQDIGAFGAATVDGAVGPVALAVTYLRDRDTGTAEMISGQYAGLAQVSAGTALYAPLVFNRHGGWDSGINVVNTSDLSTVVTVRLIASEQSAYAGTTVELSQEVAGHSSGNFYLPTESTVPAPNFYGAAEITSDQDVLVIVNSVNYTASAGAVGSCYAAVAAAAASDSVAGPLVFRAYGDSDTGVNVQNLSTQDSAVTMVVYRSGSAEQWSFTKNVPASGVVTFHLPTLMPSVTGVYGSAVVRSADSTPILAVFNAPAYARGLSANYVGINYTSN